MDALAALILQIAWGADEALDGTPRDWLAAPERAEQRSSNDQPRPAARPGPPSGTPAAQASAGAGPRQTAAARASAVAAAAASLPALCEAIAGFRDCPLASTATHTVVPAVPSDTQVIFVDDVPGADEDLSGKPLSGSSGALFGRMLHSIGLDRAAVGIIPVIPWRPPGGRAPAAAEMAICLPFLHRALALAPPSLIVPFGTLAARTLTGADGTIRRLRGRRCDATIPGAGQRQILPMTHPVTLLKEPALKKDAWADLLQIQEILKSK